jgi:hypothetical protein
MMTTESIKEVFPADSGRPQMRHKRRNSGQQNLVKAGEVQYFRAHGKKLRVLARRDDWYAVCLHSDS